MFGEKKDEDTKMAPPEMEEDDNMGEFLNEEDPVHEDEKNETNEKEKKGDERTQDNEETQDADNDITPEPRERWFPILPRKIFCIQK